MSTVEEVESVVLQPVIFTNLKAGLITKKMWQMIQIAVKL